MRARRAVQVPGRQAVDDCAANRGVSASSSISRCQPTIGIASSRRPASLEGAEDLLAALDEAVVNARGSGKRIREIPEELLQQAGNAIDVSWKKLSGFRNSTNSSLRLTAALAQRPTYST